MVRYEVDRKKRKEENRRYLKEFSRYLEKKKLSKKTIEKHIQNIDFYINTFLLYENPEKASEGVRRLDYFLGFWFIRKAMWSSPSSMKDNIASLKHFYTYMNEIGEVSDEALSDMLAEIRECKNEWIETVKQYNNPDADIEDDW